jgi:hypothetical protein
MVRIHPPLDERLPHAGDFPLVPNHPDIARLLGYVDCSSHVNTSWVISAFDTAGEVVQALIRSLGIAMMS